MTPSARPAADAPLNSDPGEDPPEQPDECAATAEIAPTDASGRSHDESRRAAAERQAMSVLDELRARELEQANAIRVILGDRIDAVVAARDFGAATATKRGRNPRYPYVPVVKLRSDGSPLGGYGSARTRQLKGLAYPTRGEAVARAQAQIESWRRAFAADLCKPRMRALREYYGLPRNPLDEPPPDPSGLKQ